MKLIWAPSARRDRREIREYIERDNPTAALAMDQLFERKAAVLLEHPRLGRRGRAAGTRELVVHQNYILIYDLADDDLVRIVRVLHGARRWPPIVE
jgi:addiction module RelE/StbE family toxin